MLNLVLPLAPGVTGGQGCAADGTLGCALEGVKPWVVLFAAVLPAMGAAIASVRFTGDFEGFAVRSQETADSLDRLRADYERAEDRVDFDTTAETLIDTARSMTEDLSGWKSLYALKRLTLPA